METDTRQIASQLVTSPSEYFVEGNPEDHVVFAVDIENETAIAVGNDHWTTLIQAQYVQDVQDEEESDGLVWEWRTVDEENEDELEGDGVMISKSIDQSTPPSALSKLKGVWTRDNVCRHPLVFSTLAGLLVAGIVATFIGMLSVRVTKEPMPPRQAFTDTQELYDAIDVYLFSGYDLKAEVTRKYGDPIGTWDVSLVTDFTGAFYRYGTFNEDISGWNTSSAIYMTALFAGAFSFNGDLSRWDTSHVIDMSDMFHYATSFNGDLSQWDTSEVNNMNRMFSRANSFNGDLSSWNVAKVVDMSEMFLGAERYQGSLCPWGLQLRVDTNVTDMFANTSCPITNDPDLYLALSTSFCIACN